MDSSVNPSRSCWLCHTAEALYVSAQLALRTLVAACKIDELLEKRLEIGKNLLANIASQANALGLDLSLAEVKDIMFPGELKKTFAEVVKAQKEAQAALERARGETAALRSLANAAKMLEDNPALLSLRALQSVSATGTAGNSIVFNVPSPPASGSGKPPASS